jgi:hypothetical protein
MAALTRRVQGQPPRSKRPRSFPKRDSGIDGTIHRAVARRRLTGPRPPERDRGVYRGGRAGQQKGGAESWARYHAWNPMRVPIRKESQVALSVLSSAILRGVDPSSRSQSIRSTFSTFCVGDRSCDCIVLVCLSLSGSHRRSAAVGGSGPQMRPWIERLVRASPQWPVMILPTRHPARPNRSGDSSWRERQWEPDIADLVVGRCHGNGRDAESRRSRTVFHAAATASCHGAAASALKIRSG